MLMKQANLSDPVRNLAIFLSANPTWGVYSPSWTIGGQKFWNTMTYDDPRSATGKTDVTFTKPIFFFDIYNTFRFKHSSCVPASAMCSSVAYRIWLMIVVSSTLCRKHEAVVTAWISLSVTPSTPRRANIKAQVQVKPNRSA